MEVLVILMLVVGIAIAIAAFFVVREAGRLTTEPPPVVFSLDEAYDWVVEELPDVVAATLTPADVRRILRYQVEYLDDAGVATTGGANGDAPHPPAVVGAPELVDYIIGRAADDGETFIPEQVHPVVEVLFEYLAATGAVSTPADPDQ